MPWDDVSGRNVMLWDDASERNVMPRNGASGKNVMPWDGASERNVMSWNDVSERNVMSWDNVSAIMYVLGGDSMKILYGTTNKGKLQAMKLAVKTLNIELVGLKDMEGKLPCINENGKTPLENAEIKAKAYYEAFHMPVFSCDSGLYFDEVKEDEQPGIHVRRVNGKELSDDEMIQYYASLAKRYGGKITGRYRNAIYFILDETHHYSSMDMSIATEAFELGTVPHSKRVDGFPLDSLSIDIRSGKYYYDLEVKDVSTSVDDGVRKFFADVFAGVFTGASTSDVDETFYKNR